MYYYKVFMNVAEKYKNINEGKTNRYVINNRVDVQVLDDVIKRPMASPKNRAEFLNLKYERVNQITKYFAINSKTRRSALLSKANEYINLVMVQLSHERVDTIDDEIKNFTKDTVKYFREKCGTGRVMRSFYMVALLKLCQSKQYSDVFSEQKEWIKYLSAADAQNFFRDLTYEINKQEKGFDVNSLTEIIRESVHDNSEDNELNTNEDSQEDKIQALEFKLQTTQSTLKFIQRSLDDMVANIEKKTQVAQDEAINNFFTSINSERYGRLLDNAVIIDHKNTKLRQQKYKFPVEVMGMPMIIKNFIAFIKSIGFEPIRTWGEQFEASAEDLLYDVYEGEPFLDDDKKLVQVVYPGWKRNGVILSKPVVKEVILED